MEVWHMDSWAFSYTQDTFIFLKEHEKCLNLYCLHAAMSVNYLGSHVYQNILPNLTCREQSPFMLVCF